jgi:hypothetical protein
MDAAQIFRGNMSGNNNGGADTRAFRVPSGGGDPPPTLMFLPFAVSDSTWQGAIGGGGTDDLGWDNDDKRVTHVGDGVTDVNLFPLDIGAGGNFGTIDIGGDNSTTPTLRRQIVNGLTRQDLEYHGGALELNSSGTMTLSGDPGQKLGAIQPELQQIIGQPRIIPLYRSVSGSGNRAEYTVVGFAGCRVLDARLTGSNRQLVIQPAPMITRGGIEGQSGSSSHIYSPVVLVK